MFTGISEKIIPIFLINNCIWFLLFVIFDDVDCDFGFGIHLQNLCEKLENDKERTIKFMDSLMLLLWILITAVWLLYVVFSILIFIVGGVDMFIMIILGL